MEHNDKIHVLSTVLANHIGEPMSMTKTIAKTATDKLKAVTNEAFELARKPEFDLCQRIEDSSAELDGPAFLAMSKSQIAKKLRTHYRQVSTLIKTIDSMRAKLGLVVDLGKDLSELIDGVKENIRAKWASVRSVVASCLVIAALFGHHDSEAARTAKIESTRPSLDAVLAQGSCALPAKLGLCWSTVAKSSSPNEA